MDAEKINLLRKRISIPLTVAIKLLKKHKGDISACEKEFHHDNVMEISAVADCDQETALKYYSLCAHDQLKAIKKINGLPVIITTRENPTPRNEVGFILWPEKADGECYTTVKRNDAFVPTADFEWVINEFKAVFPVEYPEIHYTEERFDPCGHNYFDNAASRLIVERISHSDPGDAAVEKFKKELTDWMDARLEYADYLVVYGNL
ncbi:MAG: hypothetical protein LBE92_20765 [Chryseobacterium sp.]|jgi:hypothetical protein|uniref:hypothetical protein n=1 Tax=Chryseobacterium sp. TaxID=1871047 RepID=UPI0028170E6A|nr:hypothetical protein [Chryseobacterium sp.]MDR2238569.1 hypothetical protein [Chryseobacterium sp.]